MYYTIGQRIPIQTPPYHLTKMYIALKNTHSNSLTLVQYDDPLLFTKTILVKYTDWNWLSDSSPSLPPYKYKEQLEKGGFLEGNSRCRLPQDLISCKMSLFEEGEMLRFELEKDVRGATKGQFMVFYDGDICVGSGKIHRVLRE